MRAVRDAVLVLSALSVAVVFLLAGCGPQQTQVEITQVSNPSAVSSAATKPAAAMPSYPILLVDLPRYQAGQPVTPVRSRMASAQREVEYSSTTVAPVPAPASPIVAHPAPSPKSDPRDLRYVP